VLAEVRQSGEDLIAITGSRHSLHSDRQEAAGSPSSSSRLAATPEGRTLWRRWLHRRVHDAVSRVRHPVPHPVGPFPGVTGLIPGETRSFGVQVSRSGCTIHTFGSQYERRSSAVSMRTRPSPRETHTRRTPGRSFRSRPRGSSAPIGLGRTPDRR
jgi:hypothetical protein